MSWDISGDSRPQRLPRRLIAAFVAATLTGAALAAPPARGRSASPPTVATGLIVQLRDAPEHSEFVRERAQLQSSPSGAVGLPLAAREHARWQRALQAVPEMRLATAFRSKRCEGAPGRPPSFCAS